MGIFNKVADLVVDTAKQSVEDVKRVASNADPTDPKTIERIKQIKATAKELVR